MKTIEDYLKDPSLSDEPMPLREIHAARMLIHDRTKHMSADELDNYYVKRLEEVRVKYGIKVMPSAM